MHDVIVVGTGPSGASAAYELSKSGFRVLILEREKLPRYKACGGGIPLSFFKTLPSCVQKTKETILEKGICFGRNDRQFSSSDFPKIVGVMRDRFDYEFTSAAVNEGAELLDATPVLSLEDQGDHVTVNTKGRTFEAAYVIGADGATGVVKRSFKTHSFMKQGAALEVELPVFNPNPSNEPTLVHFGLIRDGYAWLFPKKTMISVGIVSFRRDKGVLKQKLVEWAGLRGISLKGSKVHGHPIPLWVKRHPLATGRILLVGDAAGTADPLGGEGIRYGIISGRIAASTIESSDSDTIRPSEYTSKLYEVIHRDFVHARILANVFYRYPDLGFKLLIRNPKAISVLDHILNGNLRFRDLIGRGLRGLVQPKLIREFFR